MSVTVLPESVAKKMKECAYKAGWHWAKRLKGDPSDADAEEINFKKQADSLKKAAVGLLSESTCDGITSMFWSAAKHVVDRRAGKDTDGSADRYYMERHFPNIPKEITEQLYKNIRWMCWHTAWYAANKIFNFDDHTKRDEANVNAYFDKIKGELRLVKMDFFTDKAKHIAENPKVIAKQVLHNDSDVEQKMAFEFSVNSGSTSSISTRFGFEFGVKQGAKAEFLGVGGSFEEVPYELVFDVGGGNQISFEGVWHGVAVSKATYHVEPA